MQEIPAVHSTRIEAELLRRAPDGNLPAEPETVMAGGSLTLQSIEMTVPLDAFYRTTALIA